MTGMTDAEIEESLSAIIREAAGSSEKLLRMVRAARDVERERCARKAFDLLKHQPSNTPYAAGWNNACITIMENIRGL